jgi:hypothetical protein
MRLSVFASIFCLAAPQVLGALAARAQNPFPNLDVVPASAPISYERIGTLDVPRVRPAGAAQVLGARPPAVALEGSLEEWQAAPQVLQGVQDYTRRGGVVILHTDAAQAFGFKTIAPRSRTRRKAGQLFGRARPSLHFGLHPLLSKGLSASGEGAGFGSIGVRLVFYRMAAGDCLALGHEDGVPILRETDIANPSIDGTDAPTGEFMPLPSSLVAMSHGTYHQDRVRMSRFRFPSTSAKDKQGGGSPLFNVEHASALAPFGRGWALVLPRVIETHRGDGRTFARNVEKLIRDLASGEVVGVPSAPIERAYDRWKRARRVDWARVAAEMRAGAASEDVYASDGEVAAMLALDSDQALSRAQVAERFGIVRQQARRLGEADFFFAVANGMESLKRRRLMYLAQSRFRLLVSRGELGRILATLDHAASEQRAVRLRAEKLPTEAEPPPSNSVDRGASEAPSPADEDEASGADSSDASSESIPVSEDEMRFASYRAAVGKVFILRTHTVALSRAGYYPETRQWIITARRLALDPVDFWLWRGILAAGEADDASFNAWLRSTTLGDALVSWSRAVAVAEVNAGQTADQSVSQSEGAQHSDDLPMLSPLRAFGNDVDATLRERALRAERAAQRSAQRSRLSTGAQVPARASEDGPGASPSRKPVEVGSIPGAEMEKWMRGAAWARSVLARDAPVGGEVISSRLGRAHYDPLGQPLDNPSLNPHSVFLLNGLLGGPTYQDELIGNGGGPLFSGMGLNIPLLPDMGWKTVIARRGWLEDSSFGPSAHMMALLNSDLLDPLNKKAVLSNRMFSGRGHKGDWSPIGWDINRYADYVRPNLIAQCRTTLERHSRLALFGWGADREDITLTPGATSAATLTLAILDASAVVIEEEAREENRRPDTSGVRDLRRAILEQVGRDNAFRQAVSSPLALLSNPAPGARFVGGANSGLVLGTRIFVPTIPDYAQWQTEHRLRHILANSGSLTVPDSADWELFKRRLLRRQIRAAVGIPSALARSHADALINTIAEGGTPPPPWMRDGFVALSRRFMARALTEKGFPTHERYDIPLPSTERLAPIHRQPSTTRSRQQEETLPGQGGPGGTRPVRSLPRLVTERIAELDDVDIWWDSSSHYLASCAEIALHGLAENPGAHLLPLLYEEVGAGGVTEIMQRLGSGASVDEAFAAVTGQSEQDWVAGQSPQQR